MTVVQIYGDGGQINYTVTIRNTKVDYNLGDEQQSFEIPFGSLPQSNMLALKRLKRNLTLRGYVDASSSSKSGSDTAREAMVDLTNFMIQYGNTSTGRPHYLRWGDSGISYSAGTSDPGTSTGCVFKGYITKMTVIEHPRGVATPEDFEVLVTFSIGDEI